MISVTQLYAEAIHGDAQRALVNRVFTSGWQERP